MREVLQRKGSIKIQRYCMQTIKKTAHSYFTRRQRRKGSINRQT